TKNGIYASCWWISTLCGMSVARPSAVHERRGIQWCVQTPVCLSQRGWCQRVRALFRLSFA
ncbi:MAG: hypothetical protein AB2615_08530, partial [Candidatus Thiodiazotropha sp.]